MKNKKLIALALGTLVVFTGCGDKIETLTCKDASTTGGMTDLNQTVEFAFENNKLASMKLTQDYTVLDEYLEQKDTIIELAKDDNYDEFIETENGYKTINSYNNEEDIKLAIQQFKDDYNDDLSYKSLKTALEEENMTCE